MTLRASTNDQREQHHHVGRRERVEDDLGQEVGREAGRAIGEDEDAGQHRDEHGDARENQPRVVAERPAQPARGW